MGFGGLFVAHDPAWQREFERQIDEARPILLSIAARIVGPDEAEDVVQTALMRTWREAPKLKGPQCYARWATTVVRYSAIDAHRKRVRHAETALPDGEETSRLQPNRPTDAESAVLGKLDEEKAIRALGAMSETNAQVLFERDGLDMDYADILARHGLTFGQLRNILHRSRAKFKREFARLGLGLGALIAPLRGRSAPSSTGTGTHGAHAASAASRVSRSSLASAAGGAAKATLVPRFALGIAGAVAMGGIGLAIALNSGQAPAPDTVPMAAVISTQSTSASPVPSPASPSAIRSTPSASTPTPPATSPRATTPARTAPVRPVATTAPSTQPRPVQHPVSSTPALPAAPVAPQPTPAQSTTPAAPPKLGGLTGGTGNDTGAGQPTKVTITPACRSDAPAAMSVRWIIANSSGSPAIIADHNGTGPALTIPGGATSPWTQTLPAGDTALWWVKIADTHGTQLAAANYSGPFIGSLPSCS